MKKIFTKEYLNKNVSKFSYIEYHNTNVDANKHFFTLFWFTNYIPGHPDGEYKFHWRAQEFVTSPKKYGFKIPEQKDIGNTYHHNVKGI